jgi:polysaccharide export outer membrane protein
MQAQAPGVVNVLSADVHSTTPNTASPALADDYVIGLDDVLQVSILDVPELSGEYRVGNTGKVTLPILAGPVTAAGLTLSQFSESLTKELKAAGLVSDPHVSTSVNQSRTHAVAISGAVKKPQIYPVFGKTTLLDMLSQSEGLADDASNTAIVHRGEIAIHAQEASSGKTLTGEQLAAAQTVIVDLKRVQESGDPKLNLNIYPGDRITVPPAGIVYVVGAVHKPGGFTMKPSARGMTVLQALALAEDTTGTAKRNRTVIIRNDPESPQGRKQIPVELKKVLRGKSPDPVLQAEDILFVPDSAGRHALNRGFDAVVSVSTGVAVYRGR